MTSAGPPGAGAGAPAPRLRVGLLLDGFVQPHWVERMLSQVRQGGDAEIALVVLNDAPARRPANPLTRAWRGRGTLLYSLYSRLDDARYAKPDDAFAPRDLTALLDGVPVLHVRPRQTLFSDCFEDADVERIASHALDVVVRLGFRILRGNALQVARHGVWSLHHGDAECNRGGPPGFWEVMEGTPVTGSMLQVLDEELDGGRVLYRSWSQTDPRSVRCNRENLYWKTASFIPRKLRALRERGAAALDVGPEVAGFRPYAARLRRAPSNAQMLGGLARLLGRALRDRVEKLCFFEQWSLAVGFHESLPPTLHRFRELLPPRDRIWADPFPFEHDGRLYVFVEEGHRGASRAHIAVMEVEPDGRMTTPRTVLERPYHLSYPFVFAWNGDLWMIPETLEQRTVEIYRCAGFPDRWELERVLLEGVNACDATLLEDGGRFWMFVCIAVDGSAVMDELHLYHAETPLGPWCPVRDNPVRSDVRSARPAGRIFRWDGAWIRPAQDCSGRYGRAVRFQRIERLDLEGYAESEQGAIEPDWSRDVLGTHTWNACGDLAVIDLIKRRRRF